VIEQKRRRDDFLQDILIKAAGIDLCTYWKNTSGTTYSSNAKRC